MKNVQRNTAAIALIVAGAFGSAHASTADSTRADAIIADAAAASIYHLYVSPSGSDSNAGSISKPFRTISKAASVAKPSTTVHVAPGTYTNVTNSKSGTAAGRLRFVSDSKWGAKIIGTGTGAHFTNNGSYVDIVGFDISGTGRLGIVNYGSFTSIEGNHVHNLKISGGCNGDGGAGIVDANYSATDDDIIGNVVHDIGVPGACNGVQGIYHSNLRGKITNNVVYRVSAWGIHLWHAATNVVIANNTVFRNGTSSMGGGIEIGSGDAPGGIVLKNTTIANNIVYDNAGASITQYCYSGVSCIGAGNVTENNLVYGNGRGVSLKTGSAVGTIAAAPLFVNYLPTGTGDYHLKSNSPGVNKGTTRNAPTVDIDGRARPLGGAVDVGAYENF